jgi:CRP-like cAMP-binding protein
MARGTPDPVVEALSKVDLFSELDPKDLKVIAALAKPYKFPAGEQIVAQGDTSARFYLITEGTADVFVNGKRVAQLGPDEYFGEMAVIDRLPRSASVVATTPVSSLSLASFSLRPVLRQNPDVALKLLVKLSIRLRRAEAAPTA